MAVVANGFKEIHNGRDGGDDITRGTNVRRYIRVFRAVTDDPNDDATVVLGHGDCPEEGAVHNNDSSAWCQRRRARNEGFSKLVWIVTINYSTERELSTSPLSDPVQISWDTESFQSIVTKDIYGNGILNSAGDPYDPAAEKDDGRWTVTTRKNVTSAPAWLLSYRQAVNNAPFTIDGITVATRRGKVQAINISPAQRRNDVAFRVITIRLQLKDEEWDLSLLDAGFHEIGGSGAGSGAGSGSGCECPTRVDCCGSGQRKLIILCECEEPVVPVLLDGAGHVLADPNIYNAVFRTHRVYNEKDFSILPIS